MGPVTLLAGRHAVLTFALPEDEWALRDALTAGRWKSMLWELDQELRAHVKHGDDDKTRDLAAWMRGRLRAAIVDAGLAEEFER